MDSVQVACGLISSTARAVAAQILSSKFFRESKTVSCYLSMQGEVDTTPIVSEILRSGKTLFVPKIDKTTEGRMVLLRVYDEDDQGALPSGVWGIKEPLDTWNGKPRLNALDAGVDVILVPGVAFDRSLSRLGHGKGYYDRFLSSYVASMGSPPLLVALALREQVLDAGKIPTGENDWKMDMIVTADGVLDEVE